MRHAHPVLVLAVLLAVLLAAGCAGSEAQKELIVPPERPLLLNSLSFLVKAGVNANRPVRVVLVRVPDTRLVAELMRIETTAWFGAGGEAFRRLHPDAFYDDWELVPGRAAGPFEVAVDALVAGVLFCGTRAGSLPLRVELGADVTVTVGADDCVLDGGRPSQPGGRRSGPYIMNPFKSLFLFQNMW